MKWFLLICIRLFQFIFLVLPLIVLGVFVIGLYVLIKGINFISLPKYLKWWDNYEGNVSGIDNIYESRDIFKKDNRLTRFYWLALRNPLNYFQYSVLGERVKYKRAPKKSVKYKNFDLQINQYNTKRSKLTLIKYTDEFHEKPLLELYYTYDWPFNRHLRVRVGHKLQHNFGHIRQWVFSITPFRKMS